MLPHSFLFRFFLLLYLFLSISHADSLPREEGGEDDDSSVSREVFFLDGGPSDVTWVVQITDLHLSSYHPDRADDLKRLLAPALRIVRPSLLLITGDLTDAKSKDRTTTRQDLSEWLQYKQTMEAVAKESGMSLRTFIDIRGNHDKYGVPYVGDKLDFFSNYSISSQFNRLTTVQSICLMGKEWNYVFLGLDDSLEVGLRCPSNLFGHTNDKRLQSLSSELQYWDAHLDGPVTKVVFGHFPMSFIRSSETGQCYENIFARESVSAYLCGHLHAKFSKHLWRHHLIQNTVGARQGVVGEFWEWELGDWKEYKLFRILGIDHGHVSFVDLSLSDLFHPGKGFQTAILVTYPLDSRNMNSMNIKSSDARDDVSALIFSTTPINQVKAKIFDSSRDFELVEELLLHQSYSSSTSCLYRGSLNASKYRHMPPTRFWLQVMAVDIHGNETATELRPFSMDGKPAHLQKTWLEYLVLHVKWDTTYKVLLWGNICFLLLLLFLPKLLTYFIEKNMSYQKWTMSISISSPTCRRRNIFFPLWFLLEGSRDGKVWFSMALYLLYLLMFPWFWGHAASEDGMLSHISIHGWTVSLPGGIRKDSVASLDIMAITLPFMYLVVSPLFLLVYCMFTERSLFNLHSGSKLRCSQKSKSLMPKMARSLQEAADGKNPRVDHNAKALSCKICSGWTRTGLLLASMVVLYINFTLCTYLARAYGAVVVILSPGLLWGPTLLLAYAICSSRLGVGTYSLEPSCSQ
ncbi:putative metallophosphoesterase At3g03305 [Nymphaea colorata]|nr:putative metallophosphoesterase At3g03305 [Nymphaea colorata]